MELPPQTGHGRALVYAPLTHIGVQHDLIGQRAQQIAVKSVTVHFAVSLPGLRLKNEPIPRPVPPVTYGVAGASVELERAERQQPARNECEQAPPVGLTLQLGQS